MPRFKPKWMSEHEGDPTSQENRVAKSIGGKRQRGSGASVYAKGDVKQASHKSHDLESFLVECKQTKHASMSIKGDWLAKISKEAFAAGLEPALAFQIKGCADPMMEQDWVAVPMSVFKRLTSKEE